MGSISVCDEYDVLIIGAGLSGVCSLYHMRKRFPGWKVGAIEAGSSPGGTWYWNRYPGEHYSVAAIARLTCHFKGARFDCESVSYAYSWDQELLDEWEWTETFSAQPDTLRYIERVCEKHDLNKHITYDTRIVSATWQEGIRKWLFISDTGKEFRTTFFVSCLGFLSSPTLPNIPGIEKFSGEAYHTSRWPTDFDLKRDFAGKRIGVIGTGATGIQTITAVAQEPSIKSLTVFQRTANWAAPLRNSPISNQEMTKLKQNYPQMFARCNETPMAFLHMSDPRGSSEVTDEERLALWEKVYAEPGFGKWLGVFSDTYSNSEANRLYSEFMAGKIRGRIVDPATADKLIPKDHGFGTRRVPLESGYFEVYNQDNVHLVDLRETPIEQITSQGIQLSNGNVHDLDILIYATGFDAITGAFSAIDWTAKNGRPLMRTSSQARKSGENPIWRDFNPRTLLGLTIPSMPNTFTVLGPHQPFGNAPRSIEHAVQVICSLLEYCHDNEFTYVEPTEEAVDKWTEHVVECSKGALSNEVDSWMTGVNTNVPGKTVRNVARYSGSAIEYRRRCEECRQNGWEGLMFA